MPRNSSHKDSQEDAVQVKEEKWKIFGIQHTRKSPKVKSNKSRRVFISCEDFHISLEFRLVDSFAKTC